MPDTKPVQAEKRGGAGRGQGRKPIGGTGTTRINISIDAATRARLIEIGDGNLSAGIRIAAANFPPEKKRLTA